MGRTKQTIVEYRNYELPAGFPIVALTGEQWHISHVPSKRLHIHNCLEIGLCHTERGTLIFGERQAAFTAGEVTCIARNVPHTTFSAPGCASLWSYLFLNPQTLLSGFISEQLADSLSLQRMLCASHLILSPEKYPEAQTLVSSILREMTLRRPNYEISVRGLCLSLLVTLLRAYDENADADSEDRVMAAITPALDYVHEHYMQDFPQQALAAACHLSQTHFRRLFHEQMGVSPLSFLHQTRVLESCTLLLTSDRSIAETAGLVGYTSLSSYNRSFSRIMGCTPSAWRKSAGQASRASVLSYSGWMMAE